MIHGCAKWIYPFFLIYLVHSDRNIWSRNEAKVFGMIFSGVVPPLFLERWTGFDMDKVGAIEIWRQ